MPESLVMNTESAALERHILRSVEAAVIATRLDGTIIYWNLFAEQLYGWFAADMLGRNIVDIVVPSQSATQGEQIMTELSQGKSWSGEFKVRRADGNVFTALVIDSPLYNEHGKLIGIVGVSHDLSAERQEIEREVKQRTSALRALSQRLLHTQDDERRKIARELHDGMGQSLALLKMNLASIADSEGRIKQQVVQDMRTLADQCLGEIRTLAYLLHPPLLESLGLKTAVEWLTEGFGKRSGIQVICDVMDELPRLSHSAETAIYRILQEALANIHRHSGSAIAEVELSAADGIIRLVVRDFGRGIPKEVLDKGLNRGVGLAGIRERVEELNGTFRLDSDLQGTKLDVKVPLAEHLTESDSASA